MVRYDPYTDSFIDDLIKDTTATINLDAFPKYNIQYTVEVSDESVEKIADAVVRKLADCRTEPQTDCYVSDLCKHYGDKQICGRCRSRNLFCEVEPQPRCPKCGKRGYIRSLESMGVKLKRFDEYKWKCTNCNKYFKEEPKDEPQTEREGE